jgi:hypothetical protein
VPNTDVDTLTKEMLTLAAITYAGFAKPNATSDELGLAMTDLLRTLDPVTDSWELIWGPASFRAGLNAFDDAAMYVARRRTNHSQIAVAVRGTNPISLFDWLFGDLVVARQVPWAYGKPTETIGAKISFSTALGVSILQHLRWRTGPSTTAPTANTRATTATRSALTERARGALRGLRDQLAQSVRRADEPTGNARFDLPADWAEKIFTQRSSSNAAAALDAFDSVVAELAETRLDPLRLLLGGTRVQQSFAPGMTLQEFLKDRVAEATSLDVYVTGHSKGGALCTALGVWLADTQGTAHVAPADQWDPQGKATVHVYGFAGPTPGNGAFARHANAVLETRCHRIANKFDVVPCAFATADLQRIAGLYGSPEPEQRALQKLSARIVRDLEGLDYQHAGREVLLEGRQLSRAPLAKHVVHHHLDGYFEALGLQPRTPTFFDPLPPRR